MTKFITALALSIAALSAQAQAFNDRTEIRFDAPSRAAQVAVQAQMEGFNDRTTVSFKTEPAVQPDLSLQMVKADLTGFNDKS